MKLRVDRKRGQAAPHKPLLPLVVLELAEKGELPPATLPLSPELAFRFCTSWTAGTALLADPANELFLSMASVWEIAVKTGLKKLALSAPFITFMTRAATGYGISLLPLTTDDCAAYEQLPFPDPPQIRESYALCC